MTISVYKYRFIEENSTVILFALDRQKIKIRGKRRGVHQHDLLIGAYLVIYWSTLLYFITDKTLVRY